MTFGIKPAVLVRHYLVVNLYAKKYLKTKIKSYEGKINTNFHNDKMPRKGSYCIYLLVSISIDLFWF